MFNIKNYYPYFRLFCIIALILSTFLGAVALMACMFITGHILIGVAVFVVVLSILLTSFAKSVGYV